MDKLRNEAPTNKSSRIKIEKIDEYFEVFERLGTRAGLPYVRHIEGDLWELRPLRDRFFIIHWSQKTYIALHHFHKATQKTPQREIDVAVRNWNDFEERIDDNE